MAIEVKFFDLTRQIKSMLPQLRKAIDEIVENGDFIMGKAVKELEQKIAELVGTSFAVAVASGTDALLLSLKALGVSKSDAVITTPFTFFSTASTIVRAGASPLFVDIDPQTFNISVSAVENFLEKECHRDKNGAIVHKSTNLRVKGILPVHLFGQMAQTSKLQEIAQKRDLFLLEDSAQAIGAWEENNGTKAMAGSIGDAGAFSFYPTKNLGAFGDAGMVTTRSEKIAERIRLLRVHGSTDKDTFVEIGYLSRMDTLQAAVLLAKLPMLTEWNKKRAKLAQNYLEMIRSQKWAEEIGLPLPQNGRNHTYHQFVIRVKKRDELSAHLKANGIGCAMYYSKPLHIQPAFQKWGYKKGDFPEAEKASEETLALPIWPELKEEEQERVVEVINSFYN